MYAVTCAVCRSAGEGWQHRQPRGLGEPDAAPQESAPHVGGLRREWRRAQQRLLARLAALQAGGGGRGGARRRRGSHARGRARGPAASAQRRRTQLVTFIYL